MRDCRILHVVGARPNFMKIAPILRACGETDGLSSTMVHTGQHYDQRMSRLFFEELSIPRPDIDLEVGSGTHAVQTAAIMERFETVVEERRPDLVLVVGDVNSTLACSVVAAKACVPVAHVEAGLRSFDRTMPEEINRLVTDAIAELLFASEPSGVENLKKVGVDPSRIHFVGNVMIDTLLQHREAARDSRVLEELGVEDGAYAALTLHRPANVDDSEKLAEILAPVVELSTEYPVVFPVHPRTRSVIESVPGVLAGDARVRLAEPMGYLDFLRLMMGARVILTDSGGIQEESTILGVPCVTIRENTERPATLTHGTNVLAGVSGEGIRRAVRDALKSDRGVHEVPPLWDGKAARRIARILRDWWRP